MQRDADPVVEQRTIVRQECPAELRAPVPAKPKRPAGGSITGDDATIAWFGQVVRWGEGLAARLTDAAKPCS